MLLFEVPKWNLCLSVSHCASCMVIINYLMYLAEWTSHWSSILSLHEKICEGCVADKQRTNVQHIHMCSYMENISHKSLLVCAAVDLLFDFSKSWRHPFGGLRPQLNYFWAFIPHVSSYPHTFCCPLSSTPMKSMNPSHKPIHPPSSPLAAKGSPAIPLLIARLELLSEFFRAFSCLLPQV